MDTQERRDKLTTRSQLRDLTHTAAAEVVDCLVEQFGGDNYSLLKSRPDIWPPIDTTESEALTRLVAARELEQAAHAAQRDFIRQARETGRSWYEIGQALDLLWHAIASNEIRLRRGLPLRAQARASREPRQLHVDVPGLPADSHRPWTLAPSTGPGRRPRDRLPALGPPSRGLAGLSLVSPPVYFQCKRCRG